MKNLSYKGFTGSLDASIDDECLVGEVLFIDDIITYEGETVAEIKQAFESAVDRYLDYCTRNNKNPCKPYSGSFNVRLGPELHRQATIKSHAIGISLNEFMIRAATDSINGASIEAANTMWSLMTSSTTSQQKTMSLNSTAKIPENWRVINGTR